MQGSLRVALFFAPKGVLRASILSRKLQFYEAQYGE